MTTALHAVQNLQPTSADDFNQFLSVNAAEFTMWADDLFVQGSEWAGSVNLYNLMLDQPFFLPGAGSVSPRSVAVAMTPVGAGCDVRLSLWTDQGGNPHTLVNASLFPKAWFQMASPLALSQTGQDWTPPALNTMLVGQWTLQPELTPPVNFQITPNITFVQTPNTLVALSGIDANNLATATASAVWTGTTLAAWTGSGNSPLPQDLRCTGACVTSDGYLVIAGGWHVGDVPNYSGYPVPISTRATPTNVVYSALIDVGNGQASSWQAQPTIPLGAHWADTNIALEYVSDSTGTWIYAFGINPDNNNALHIYDTYTPAEPTLAQTWRAPYTAGGTIGNWTQVQGARSYFAPGTAVVGDFVVQSSTQTPLNELSKIADVYGYAVSGAPISDPQPMQNVLGGGTTYYAPTAEFTGTTRTLLEFIPSTVVLQPDTGVWSQLGAKLLGPSAVVGACFIDAMGVVGSGDSTGLALSPWTSNTPWTSTPVGGTAWSNLTNALGSTYTQTNEPQSVFDGTLGGNWTMMSAMTPPVYPTFSFPSLLSTSLWQLYTYAPLRTGETLPSLPSRLQAMVAALPRQQNKPRPSAAPDNSIISMGVIETAYSIAYFENNDVHPAVAFTPYNPTLTLVSGDYHQDNGYITNLWGTAGSSGNVDVLLSYPILSWGTSQDGLNALVLATNTRVNSPLPIDWQASDPGYFLPAFDNGICSCNVQVNYRSGGAATHFQDAVHFFLPGSTTGPWYGMYGATATPAFICAAPLPANPSGGSSSITAGTKYHLVIETLNDTPSNTVQVHLAGDSAYSAREATPGTISSASWTGLSPAGGVFMTLGSSDGVHVTTSLGGQGGSNVVWYGEANSESSSFFAQPFTEQTLLVYDLPYGNLRVIANWAGLASSVQYVTDTPAQPLLNAPVAVATASTVANPFSNIGTPPGVYPSLTLYPSVILYPGP
jgi:hypothetical protein